MNPYPSLGYARWRPHPWHGLEPGPDCPRIVNAFIEITPFDLMKYEVDKATGYLRVDRPQRTSSHPPSLYGFIPQTYCGDRVRRLASGCERGDGDPLDICVISERPITHSEVLLCARVVGGLKIIDRGEADDKIVAVLEGDYICGGARDLAEVPAALLERLEHYFSTYKLVPGEPANIAVVGRYGYEHAARVVSAAIEDYRGAISGATEATHGSRDR
ncbi:MAG TPA: inorganic pyrophosphatase [Steroidobacteraceae bacterium]|nr:inorganic pyrophosphatase [Steroidobacteraceae bacterium]